MDQITSNAMIAGFLAGTAIALGLLALAYPALLTRFNQRFKSRLGRKKAADSHGESADIPPHHVAVIAATVAAITGPHRIVRIQPLNHGHSWQTQGRAAHHGSHAIFHPGASQRQPDHKGNRHGTDIQNHGRRPGL